MPGRGVDLARLDVGADDLERGLPEQERVLPPDQVDRGLRGGGGHSADARTRPCDPKVTITSPSSSVRNTVHGIAQRLENLGTGWP